MNQLAPEAVGVPLARSGHVKNMYAYDVNAMDGAVEATIKIDDITGNMVDVGKNMGVTTVCPVSTGAAIQSATGGEVLGFDMYGQQILEVLSAATPSKYAYAALIAGPADLEWLNVFGLPYKYVSDSDTTATYVGPAADGDPRGTFEPTDAPTGPQEFVVNYLADTTDLMGENLKERFASDPLNSDPVVVTGTVDNTGATAVIVPIPADGNPNITIVWGDGSVERTVTDGSTPIVHTMNPLWMSKYARVIDDAQVDHLTAVNFDSNATPGVYVDYSGGVTPVQTGIGPDVVGPYSGPDDVEFFVNKATGLIGLNLDDDPEADFWLTRDRVVAAAPNMDPALYVAISDALVGGGLEPLPVAPTDD